MEGSRFDDVLRSFARSGSRRGFLAGLGALAAGLAGRPAGAEVTQAQCGNRTCKSNPGVCTNGCVCCVYGNGNSRCTPPGGCSGTVTGPGATTTTAAPTTTTTTSTTTAPATTTTSTSTTTAVATTTTVAPTTTTTTTAPQCIPTGSACEFFGAPCCNPFDVCSSVQNGNICI